MKKINQILGTFLAVSLLLAGCGKAPQMPASYNNLKEESVRHDLNSLLTGAGVPDERRSTLFSHVDQFNEVMKPQWLTEGFQTLDGPLYDPYALQDAWTEAHPDFLGYNCRITAFSLYEHLFRSEPEPEITPSTELLEFDLDSISLDDSAFPGRDRQFLSFFSPVPTEDTKDVEIHMENIRNAWQDRGFQFGDKKHMTMINVVFHYQDGDKNILHVGHSGVLLPTPDGDLWFLEKLAFQEPYQVVRFANRRQLQDYLMEKYDLDENQPMAKPFIMENDAMLKV